MPATPPLTSTLHRDQKGGQGTRAHTYLMHALTHMLSPPKWGVYGHGKSIPCSWANVHMYILTSAHACTHGPALRHLHIHAWGVPSTPSHTHRPHSGVPTFPLWTHVSDLHTQLQSHLETCKHTYALPYIQVKSMFFSPFSFAHIPTL